MSVVPTVAESVSTLINRAVDILSVNLHQTLWAGNKTETRDRKINQLDEACREHDMAYAKYKYNELEVQRIECWPVKFGKS